MDCNGNWLTSWSGNEPRMKLEENQCITTLFPSTSPTIQPTSNPTFIGPTQTQRLSVTLFREFDFVQQYVDSINTNLEEWAVSIVRALCKCGSHSSLSNIIIDILLVREGSTIIEFQIQIDTPNALNLALSNINETVVNDRNVTDDIGGLTFPLEPIIGTVSPTMQPTTSPTNIPSSRPTRRRRRRRRRRSQVQQICLLFLHLWQTKSSNMFYLHIAY